MTITRRMNIIYGKFTNDLRLLFCFRCDIGSIALNFPYVNFLKVK